MEPEFPFGALEPGENPGKREHTSHHLTKVEVKKEGGTDNYSGSNFGYLKRVSLVARALYVIGSPSNLKRRNKGEALARREKKAAELSNFKFRLFSPLFVILKGNLNSF